MTDRTVEYSLMAGAAYKSTRDDANKIPYPSGWDKLDPGAGLDYRQDGMSGFEAAAFTQGTGPNRQIVISYAGTFATSPSDHMLANLPLALGVMSAQLIYAARYYEDVKRAYPDAVISFTGHSLGGGLASLMGVFFNKQAITFDQAPFRMAANLLNAQILRDDLLSQGYRVDSDLLGFFSTSPTPYIPPLYIRGENKVSVVSVDGEFLSYSSALRIAGSGSSRLIKDHGVSNLNMFTELHAQTLLIAFEQSAELRKATVQMSFLGKDIFDTNLFARDATTENRDLLTHLIRREFGVPGIPGSDTDLLTKFGNDMVKLGVYGTADTALKQGLERIALRYYYNSTSGEASEFFDKVSGGVRFDLARAGSEVLTSSSQSNAYGMLATWLAANTPAAAKAAMTEFVGGSARRFTLALGSSITATAPVDDIADFMLAGTVGGNLAGGGGNDLLVGRAGMDALIGGAGDDQLYGDAGYDTYVVGQGFDKIIDSDGSGMIQDENGDRLVGQFVQQTDGTYALLGNSSVTAVNDAGLVITLATGARAWLPDFDNFAKGELGITLYAETAAPITTRSLTGTALADAIDDRIDGGAISNDLIQGLGGNDDIATFYGGNDRVEGGDGDDWIIGADGNDVVLGGAGRDVLIEGAGNDRLYADNKIDFEDALASENDAASGLQGEALSGGSGDDLAIGGIGNDVLLGGTGDDILVAGAGDDNIEGDAMAGNIQSDWSVTRTVSGNSYASMYNQFSMNWPAVGGADVIYAGAGIDWVSAGYGNDYVDGGNDNDVVWGESGSDDLFGGDGNDILNGDNAGLPLSAHGDDYLDGEDGDDTLFGEGGSDQLFGGSGADQLYGNEGDDYLDGEDDNDTLVGGAGADQLFGGAGNDFLQGDAGNGVGDGADYLDGEAGDDLLLGLGGSDELHGGDGNDQIAGDNGGSDSSGAADSIYGGAGNDFIDGQGGDDVIDAGADNDVVAGGLGNDQIAGGAGSDQLQGGEGNDTLDGGADADTLFGEAGNDALSGGTGNDYLIGGLGDDILDGGDGDDVYFYSTGDGRDRIVDSSGTDWLVFNDLRWGQITLGVGSLKLNLPDGAELHLDDFDPDNPYAAGGIEYFQFGDGAVLTKNQLIDALGIQPTGTPEADVLSGTALSESIQALAGDDVVTARAGNDTVYAGDGADAVYAGDGNDVVYGGAGDDVLLGEAGSDTLLGEAGNDLLAGGAGTDALQGGDGDDTYLFQAGDGEDTATDALGSNAIALGAGLTLDAIVFSRSGGDLLVSVKNSTDRLTVKDWFAADSHFASVTLGDGTVLDHAAVEAAMPRNQAPLLTADSATVTEDGVITVAGNLLANDSDPEGRTLRVTNAGSYAGAVGSLSLNGNGAYSYSLANGTTAVQSLAAGQSLTENFAYTATDDDPNGAATASSSIRITVQGANDLPVLGADSAATAEDATVPLTGNLLANDHDVDAGSVLSVSNPGTRVGAYGTLNLAADGTWSYSLANASNAVQALAAGQTVTENFAQSVSDGIAQVGGTLAIAIAGRNDAPIVATPLADQSTAANTSWSWTLPAGSFSDVDAGDILGYGATLADGTALPSWLSFSAATQTFSGRVPKSATGSIDIRVAATDRAGTSAADVFALSFASGGGGGGSGGGGSQGNEGVGNGVDAPPPGHDVSFNDGTGTGPGNPGAQGGNGYRPPTRADIVMSDVRIAAPIFEAQAPVASHGNSADARAAAPGQIKQAEGAASATVADGGQTVDSAVSPAPTFATTAERVSDPIAVPDAGERGTETRWLTAADWACLDGAHDNAPSSAKSDDSVAIFAQWLAVQQALTRDSANGLPEWLDRSQGADLRGLIAANGGLGGANQAFGQDAFSLLAGAELKGFKGLAEGLQKIA